MKHVPDHCPLCGAHEIEWGELMNGTIVGWEQEIMKLAEQVRGSSFMAVGESPAPSELPDSLHKWECDCSDCTRQAEDARQWESPPINGSKE